MKLIIPLLLLITSLRADAAHTQASLLLPVETARPGDTLTVGVRLKMDEHWHTYWRNPGEGGMATKIEWQLPAGVTAGEIQWPSPEKHTAAGLTTYIFNDEVVLPVPLTLAPDLPPGAIPLKADVSWLECKELCLPGSQSIAAELNIGDEAKRSSDAAVIEEWKKQAPQTTATESGHWEDAETHSPRTLVIEWESPMKPTTADFYAYPADDYEISPATEFSAANWPTNQLRLKVTPFSTNWPAAIKGLLVATYRDGQMLLNEHGEVSVETVPPAATPAASTAGVATSADSGKSLGVMLIFAFLGGLILNVMPCVLPVIALKILGFVSQAREQPRSVRKLGFIYGAGVLVSFFVMAALVIGVKAAGHQAGWGMQFRSPEFIVILTVLVTLVALNLFGVFEVTMSGATMNTMDRLAGKHGNIGAFFNGVLATALATPCTAPFLAPALGYAFTQNAPVIAIFFLTIGAGLALPYVVLSCQPAWLKLLPKPGAWMEKFKIVIGFPMLATTLWLYDVASAFYGGRTWWLGIFLVVLALAAWVFGTFIQRGSAKPFAWAAVVFLLVSGYLYALEGNLRWRSAQDDLGDVPLKESAEGINWQKWSASAVTAARAEGRPVLVDFTAKWCATCRVNKSSALEIPAVREKLKAINAVALLGDYTKFPDDITAELAKFGRAGVPLALVYPADASQPPQILPALLTPGIVLDALDKAAKK